MLDWLTARLRCNHDGQIHGDRVVSVSPEGEVQWETKKRLEVRGSYESKLYVRSYTDGDGAQWIEVDGNPVKFFQGHNLFGTDDLVGLGAELMEQLCTILPLSPTAADRRSWWAGEWKVSCVDVTRSYRLENRAAVLAWIRAAEHSAHLRYRGKGQLTKGTTLYFGKHSRRSALKFYSKGQEIQERPLPYVLQETKLVTWADGQLRQEYRLRAMELKRRELEWAHAWTDEIPDQLNEEVIEGLTMSETVVLPCEVLAELPPRLVAVYQLWKDGYDIRGMYPKMTFYRYRRQLQEHGIDIAVRQPHEDRTNVVPLVRVLEAVPDQVPDWAYGTPLYFEPRRKVS